MAKNITILPATRKLYTPKAKAETRRRVAGYARVSTDLEQQESSYKAQLDYWQRYIEGHADWEFAGMYSDEGISGTSTRNRDGFNQMVDDALSGKIDLICTKSVSRFARNTVDSLTIIRELKEHGTEVYFEKENIFTFDSKGELLITIMSSLAQEESRSISENTTWGKRKQMRDGKYSLGYSRFLGYDKGPDGKMVVNKEQAETVKLIYSLFLSGLSCYEIANRLMADGIPAPSGGAKWWQVTVRSILTNEKYKGDALLQKYYTEDFLTHRPRKNNGELPQYLAKNDHEAIIDPEVWDHVQDEMARRDREKRSGGKTIFSSKIRCGDCGFWYGSKVWHSNDPYRKVIWQCGHKFRDKACRCQTPTLSEDEIKAAFVRAMNKVLTEKKELKENLTVLMDSCADMDALRAEQKKAEADMALYADTLNAEVERNSQVAQNQDEYRRREADLQEKYSKARDASDAAAEKLAAAETRRKEIRRLMSALDSADGPMAEFSESLWSGLVDYMTVYRDGRIVVKFKAGMEVKV